jgi:hypothetical protein
MRFDRARVVKKLRPTQPGALKLARRFGDALVCVRYRRDDEARRRYTTVELVVDEAPVVDRPPPADVQVAVRIPFDDKPLRQRAKSLGAQWDHRAGVWRMPHSIAKQLDLLKQRGKK